jgi:hypothetical protein
VDDSSPDDGTTWSLRRWPSADDVGRWLEQTTWWNTDALARTPQDALVGLVEAVAGRFTGRELTLEVRSHAVRILLHEVQVRARRLPNAFTDPIQWWAEVSGVNDLLRWSRRALGRHDDVDAPIDEVALDATDVEVDGLPVGRVQALVDGLRLDPGMPLPELVTGSIELDVRTTWAHVVTWVRREYPDWDLEASPGGLVSLRVPRWRVRLLLRPVLHGTRLRVETTGLVLFGRVLRIPRRFARVQERDLRFLVPELELIDARAEGDDISLSLRHGGIHQPMRLDAVRTAIRDGATRISDSVFR